jgi:hypothetical protein
MEVSGQLHALASIPLGKEPQVPTGISLFYNIYKKNTFFRFSLLSVLKMYDHEIVSSM